MADGVFNISKGRAAQKCATDNTKVVVVLLKAAEADGVLEDYDDLATLLAAAGNTEADFTNYARKSTPDTNVTVTVNDTDNRQEIATPQLTFASAGGATNNTMAKVIFCYNEGAGDANLVPICHQDYTAVTDGTDLVINAGDIYRAA